MFVLSPLMGLTDNETETVLGVLNLSAIPGALSAGYISSNFGRTKSISAAALLFLLGGIVLICANGYSTLMCGRVITGFGVGVGLSIDPLYIAEISPKESRGALVTMSESGSRVRALFLTLSITSGVLNLEL